jgi:glycosyltransferase involved in cell wall biosynthesis
MNYKKNGKVDVLHVTLAPFGVDGIFGGGERYALEFAKNMSKKTRTRLINFSAKKGGITFHGDLEEITLPSSWYLRGQKNNPFNFKLFKYILDAKIIHFHQNHNLMSELSAIVGKIFGKKVFATDLGGGGWGLNSYINTDRFFDGHLHISRYSQFVSQHSASIRTDVIYGGVDIDFFKPNIEVAKENLIVFVGRIMPHKGIDFLIDSLPTGLFLEIIGRVYNADYFEFLKKKCANKNVFFRQDCSDADILNSFHRAKCVVLPSLYKNIYGGETKVPELLGQSLIEGMATGIPGIATNVASLPEIIDHNIDGWIVESKDEKSLNDLLVAIRDGKVDIYNMGLKAREKVYSKFVWDKVVARALQFYEQKS